MGHSMSKVAQHASIEHGAGEHACACVGKRLCLQAHARVRVQGATEVNNERETQARTLTAQAASAQRQADKLSEAHLRALAERDAARRERDDSRALLAQLG